MQNIKEYLSYDQKTGIFTWVKRPKHSSVCVGREAGNKAYRGYIHLQFNNKNHQAHRLAWWFVNGYFPDCDVDHINEIKTDNRICNLRLDSNRENEQNVSSVRLNNTSGFIGVTWHKKHKKWRAQIKIKGKKKYLGQYNTPEEAHAAYLCAKRELHPFWVENKT
jgi:hypothetical protein